MGAIFRRELRAFFTNPIGYVVLAALFGISGFFFFTYNMMGGVADLSNLYSSLFSVVLLALPFLTMRLFSEEKRQKTDQALFTAPASLTGIVLGKFFATRCCSPSVCPSPWYLPLSLPCRSPPTG